MIRVNRTNFHAWTQGVLMERGRDARVFVADDVAHEKAVEAMNRGETIELTDNQGNVVTTMKLVEGHGYVEEVHRANITHYAVTQDGMEPGGTIGG